MFTHNPERLAAGPAQQPMLAKSICRFARQKKRKDGASQSVSIDRRNLECEEMVQTLTSVQCSVSRVFLFPVPTVFSQETGTPPS